MRILLSIKPKYAKKIFDGQKKYEFRRSIFKRAGIKTAVVYASYPISKVIGEFIIEDVLSEKIDSLWESTKEHAGISREDYLLYFEGKDIGHALKIRSTKKYGVPVCIKEQFGILPPQSFLYID